jgi:hypothetical protein
MGPQRSCYGLTARMLRRLAARVLRVALPPLAVSACEARSAPSYDAATPPAPAASGPRFVAAPPGGTVDAIARDAASKAAVERRRLLVYVGATWCEPCQRFHRALEKGELGSSLPDVTLLEFDLDLDRERLALAGYESKYIPLFAVPGPDGRGSGRQIEGAIKGEGAVAFILPRLQGLLAR